MHSQFVNDALLRFNVHPDAVEKKRWGAAIAMACCDRTQMSLAIINKGGFCSRHYHDTKVNVFNVIEGELLVHVFGEGNDIGDDIAVVDNDIEVRDPDMTHVVGPGESLQVAPGIIHEMEGRTNVICMEAYYIGPKNPTGLLLDDITRFTTGGMK